MGKDHRARLVQSMAALLRAQGFHGTSLSQVLEASGAPRGSLYFYFPGGKEELACVALEQAAHDWRLLLDSAFAGATSSAAGIRALCRAVAERLEATELDGGSPLAAVALEAAAGSERVREVCMQGYASWHEVVQRRLMSFGHDRAQAHGLAELIVSALEGATALCRVYRSTAPLDSVAGRLEALLAS